MPWRQQNENTHKMNKITKGLMVEKLGNLIACYSKKKEKVRNSISPFKLPTASNW